jgi:hypothetical protein
MNAIATKTAQQIKQAKKYINLAKCRIAQNENTRAYYEWHLTSSTCPEWQRTDTAATIRALSNHIEDDKRYLAAHGVFV